MRKQKPTEVTDDGRALTDLLRKQIRIHGGRIDAMESLPTRIWTTSDSPAHRRMDRIERAAAAYRYAYEQSGQHTEDLVTPLQGGLIGAVNAINAFVEIMSDPIEENL